MDLGYKQPFVQKASDHGSDKRQNRSIDRQMNNKFSVTNWLGCLAAYGKIHRYQQRCIGSISGSVKTLIFTVAGGRKA